MFNLQIINKAEKLILIAFIVLLALSISDQSIAQAASLKQCQKWNDKIEHYQEKKKKRWVRKTNGQMAQKNPPTQRKNSGKINAINMEKEITETQTHKPENIMKNFTAQEK